MNKEAKPLLRVRDLVVKFGHGRKAVKAIKGATFDVYPGETFGLVGESGSGKTTVGRAIMGIQPINGGAVYFQDQLIYGNAPDLFVINQKLWSHLQVMKHNYADTTVALNNYLNEFKRVFYKYTQSKYYDFKSKKLLNYPDGESRIIAEGTNLRDTKILKTKKDNNLSIVQKTIELDLVHLLKMIRLEAQADRFITGLTKHVPISDQLETAIVSVQHQVFDLLTETKRLDNEMATTVNKMIALRHLVKAGRVKSVVRYFEEMGGYLAILLNNHKQNLALLDQIIRRQLIALYLTAPNKEKRSFQGEIANRLRKATILKENDKVEYYRNVLTVGQKEDLAELVKKTPMFKPPTKKERQRLKQKMQMIFQDPSSSLNDRMAIEEIIGEGLDNFPELYKNKEASRTYLEWYNQQHPNHPIQIEDVRPNDVKRFLILQLITTVGLRPEHLSRYPHEFSGGQRQRIGIARALVMRPTFIVADEPISALDVSIRAQVMNLLAKFQKEFGLTYIFIAHDLSIVKFVADRIAVIYRGDIVELAEANELFEHPLHPYTKSLLSAIPLPDPQLERAKVAFKYQPELEHQDYLLDFPEWRKINDDHYVYANQREYNQYKKDLKLRK